MVAPLNLSVPGDIFLAGTFHYRPDPTGDGIEAVEFLVFALFMAGLNVCSRNALGIKQSTCG